MTVNMFSIPRGNVLRILSMFWNREHPDALTGMIELVTSNRTRDPWLAAFLRECREGRQSWTMYCFIHGYPTRYPGSWLPVASEDRAYTLQCGQDACYKLGDETWPEMNTHECIWQDMQLLECDICAESRAVRRRVLTQDDITAGRHRENAYVRAPYIVPFNMPRYHAMQLRAIEMANAEKKQILWAIAFDKPKAGDIMQLPPDQLAARRIRWLQRHDKATGGIMGLFPLVRDMPVYFTDTVDRSLRIFKFTKGHLVNWRLDALDRIAFENTGEREHSKCIILNRLPEYLYVKVANATWPSQVLLRGADGRVPEDLRHGVYAYKPIYRAWKLNPKQGGTNKVERKGFFLAPDFSGTAHSFTGETLPAAIVDCLGFDRTATREDMMRGYVSISRVCKHEDILIARPYAPMLFRQGVFPGPHLLMEYWRGKLQTCDLEQAWEDAEGRGDRVSNRLEDLMWPCSMCGVDLPHRAFSYHHDAVDRAKSRGIANLAKEMQKQLCDRGQWRHCSECATKLKLTSTRHRKIGEFTCTRCGAAKPDSEFDAELLRKWKKSFNLSHCATCLECAKDILCTVCQVHKAADDFDAVRLIAWRKNCHISRDAVCLACVPLKKRNFGVIDDDRLTTCSACSVSLPTHAFDVHTMQPRIKSGEISFVQCVECMDESLFIKWRPWLKKTAYTCAGPGCIGRKPQSRSVFARQVQQNRSIPNWKCEACRRPTCCRCGSREEKPLSYTWNAPYECLTCVYPPRSERGVPRGSKDRKAKNQHVVWKCLKCKQ